VLRDTGSKRFEPTRGTTSLTVYRKEQSDPMKPFSHAETTLLQHLAEDIADLSILFERSSITDDERERLRELLADEFVTHGLGLYSEPNRYGLCLEDLIDKLGHSPS
jgi:hypothetical protein